MELRFFLLPFDGFSLNCSYVDIPPLSPSATQQRGAVKVLGRHSPELYWLFGNSPHYSRRMMTLWIEEVISGDAQIGDRVHPHVAQRLMLKCVGRNMLTVLRSMSWSSQENKQNGEHCFLLRQNDVFSLRLGDRVLVADQLWLRVVLALVSVSDGVKVPVVVQQQEDHGVFLPASRALCFAPLLPLVRVDKPWRGLSTSVRSSLVAAVWQCRQRPGSTARTPAGEVFSENANTLPQPTEREADNNAEEAAAVSNPSQAPCDGETTSVSAERAGKRRRFTSSAIGHSLESRVLSLDAASLQKRCPVVAAGDCCTGFASSLTMAENNTYNDTCDELLYNNLCALELRAAIVNQLVTTGPSIPAVLGESQPREEQFEELTVGSQQDKCVALSRAQPQRGGKGYGGIQQRQSLPDREGTAHNHSAGEESQEVVYHGHYREREKE